jgi:hypothetical protein
MASAKSELLDLLERKAFDPVLHAHKQPKSDADRRRLEHQKATQAELTRYRNYDSAEEVVTNFKRDLHSEAAKRVHRELEELGLPTINDIEKEFLEKAAKLGVKH